MGYKVMKGSKKRPELDSTWPNLSKANKRYTTLRNSYRGQKVEVWVEPTIDDDPKKYRKPITGPWVGYNKPGPLKA